MAHYYTTEEFDKEKEFNAYVKRCKEQESMKIEDIPVGSCIPRGFNTMKEIIAFSKTLKPYVVDDSRYKTNNINNENT